VQWPVTSVIRRLFLIRLLALASVGAAHDVKKAVAGAPRLRAVHFASAVGWHLRYGTVRACPGTSASRCSHVASVASTLRFRDCVECLPHRTAAAIGAKDIVLQITLALEHPLRVGRTCAWLPRVTRRRVLAPFEGLAGRIGVYQCQTRIGTREVVVFIVFGRTTPTNRQLNRVNAELQRARLG
jgi:hypothetical protein